MMKIDQQHSANAGESAHATNRTYDRQKRPYTKHGLTTLKRAVRELGGRAIDATTKVGRALLQWSCSTKHDDSSRNRKSECP